eukprot:2016150-Rhodomonas_salina.2
MVVCQRQRCHIQERRAPVVALDILPIVREALHIARLLFPGFFVTAGCGEQQMPKCSPLCCCITVTVKVWLLIHRDDHDDHDNARLRLSDYDASG